MWGRTVRDLYAELHVLISSGISQHTIPQIVDRCMKASGQQPELPDESLVSRALFEKLILYLLYIADLLSKLGHDDFVGV
jgi:hypothetical protein